MLVLSRKENESIDIGPDIRITIVRVNGGKVRVGIEAPSHVQITRSELKPETKEEPANVSGDLPPS
jgi:carbon storage regulator